MRPPVFYAAAFPLLSDVQQVLERLEYMGGGDLLNLLIEQDSFPEDVTRFHVAEVQSLLSQPGWNADFLFS